LNPKPVVIFGGGDFARLAAVYLREDSDRDVVAFAVDREYVERKTLLDLPVIPFDELVAAFPPSKVDVFVAIGFSRVNQARREAYERCKALGYSFITYVSSAASIVAEVPIGENTFIFEENVIQPFVRIGSNVVLWSGNHIGHDSVIGDNCFIASHVVVSGNVSIGHSCFLGVNATVRDGVAIAPECVIGAGALIMKDTQRGEVYSVRGTAPVERKSWEVDL
jgi:sugar O-acyltransferase (sialic acid O-acetyltransferase NeuD family)